MAEVWQLIKQAIERFYEVVVAWLGGFQFDPASWDATTRLVVLGAVLLLVLWLLLRRRGSSAARRSGWPQFLVTNGSITLLTAGPGSAPAATTTANAATAAPADGGRRKPAALAAPAEGHYQLKMTVNNLNSFAVQLLELAVQTSAGGLPVIADAAAVLPPHGAVDVLVDLYDLPGDRGTVTLYLHNSASRPRSLRLVAPLEWEAWNQRYRVKGTALRIDQAGAPASEQFRRKRIGELRRQKVGSALKSAGSSVGRRVTGVFDDLKERRARAAADAAASRKARAAALQRETPISVPLAPSRSAASATSSGPSASGPQDEGEAAPPRERVEWPDAGIDAPESLGAEQRPPTTAHEPSASDDDRRAERPRLDFPDEF